MTIINSTNSLSGNSYIATISSRENAYSVQVRKEWCLTLNNEYHINEPFGNLFKVKKVPLELSGHMFLI